MLRGKEGSQRTAKAPGVAVHQNSAVRHAILHSKGGFAVRCTLCRAQNSFFISFLFLFYYF
jgi:hypothetical protein